MPTDWLVALPHGSCEIFSPPHAIFPSFSPPPKLNLHGNFVMLPNMATAFFGGVNHRLTKCTSTAMFAQFWQSPRAFPPYNQQRYGYCGEGKANISILFAYIDLRLNVY